MLPPIQIAGEARQLFCNFASQLQELSGQGKKPYFFVCYAAEAPSVTLQPSS